MVQVLVDFLAQAKVEPQIAGGTRTQARDRFLEAYSSQLSAMIRLEIVPGLRLTKNQAIYPSDERFLRPEGRTCVRALGRLGFEGAGWI